MKINIESRIIKENSSIGKIDNKIINNMANESSI